MIDTLALWVLRLVAFVQSRRRRALIENGTTLTWVDVEQFRNSMSSDESLKMMSLGFGRQDEYITVLGSEKRRSLQNLFAEAEDIRAQARPKRTRSDLEVPHGIYATGRGGGFGVSKIMREDGSDVLLDARAQCGNGVQLDETGL